MNFDRDAIKIAVRSIALPRSLRRSAAWPGKIVDSTLWESQDVYQGGLRKVDATDWELPFDLDLGLGVG